jgi:hypothetical protein
MAAALAVTVALSQCVEAAPPPTGRGADFVRVSPRDPRYFELTDGRPYIPIGFNLVSPPQPDEMEGVVRSMADHQINYCRIWLDQPPWDIEHSRSGQYDADRARHLDHFMALCRQRGIRVKMCVEYFRDIPAQKRIWSDKVLHHAANGGPFQGMNDFLTSERGIAQFKGKLAWYAKHYGDDPAVFAWELWNEMNCVRGNWRPWTKLMLAELHRLFPKNLAVQSLGSFDTTGIREWYQTLVSLEGNDVAQVHRYLDPGAPLSICRGPVDLLAADAVGELQAMTKRKPIILTETGAVKSRHSGPSELYARDRDGLLLHDMLFAPFFSGGAGTGHVWFWRQAIKQPNLWPHFARFARAVEGIDPPAEAFVSARSEDARLRLYTLKGRTCFLAWCRDRRNTWLTEIQEGQPPEMVHGSTVDVRDCGLALFSARIRLYDPWTDRWTGGKVTGGTIALPDFRRSLVLRIDAAAR